MPVTIDYMRISNEVEQLKCFCKDNIRALMSINKIIKLLDDGIDRENLRSIKRIE